MRPPGFDAEASVYRTRAWYYMGVSSVGDVGLHLAQQNCPPRCVQECIQGCRADGLSQTSCQRLCQRDCGAYGGGEPVSCGPCVNHAQTCTLCGGAVISRTCGGLPCGNGFCPQGTQCCDGLCCAADAKCCHDGHGCCDADQECASTLGVHYCIPDWLSGLF